MAYNLEKGNVVQYRGESNGIPVSFVGMVVQVSGKDVVVADINDEFNGTVFINTIDWALRNVNRLMEYEQRLKEISR